jgi:hypothetical protein
MALSFGRGIVIAKAWQHRCRGSLPLAKQSKRGRHSHWIASLGNVPLARNDEGLAHNDEGLAHNDEGLARNGEGESSLRAAKRRSNPDEEGIHTGLLRSAMCRSLAMTGGSSTMTLEQAQRSVIIPRLYMQPPEFSCFPIIGSGFEHTLFYHESNHRQRAKKVLCVNGECA